MSDYELYGDYNEIEEKPKRNNVILIIKIVAIVLCFSVVGFLGFRIFLFNYYPDSVSKIYYNDTLKKYYSETDGNIGALTQSLRFPYDNENEGNFFCNNLIVIKGAGQIQLSVRYNTTLTDKLGVNFDTDDVSFTLRRSGGDEEATGAAAGVTLDALLVVCEWDEFMFYKYAKLVFEGIDFDDDIKWLRLDITIDGVERDEPFMVCIYEDNDANSKFTEYKLSAGEKLK